MWTPHLKKWGSIDPLDPMAPVHRYDIVSCVTFKSHSSNSKTFFFGDPRETQPNLE